MDPSSTAYDDKLCEDYRSGDTLGFVGGLSGILAAIAPARPGFCATDDCAGQSLSVWQRSQEAAEQYYDRTSACEFTTFVGYEWSGAPLGNNWHRNVIFKNRQAPQVPPTYIEAPWPEELWRQLDSSCTGAGTGCEVLTIPHNSNISAGTMFVPLSESASPLTAEQSATRARMEPLVEMYQHKGSSECTRGFDDILGGVDELCGFENVHTPVCTGDVSDPPECTPLCSEAGGVGFLAQCADPGDFVRNALGAGLVEQARTGSNPFSYGFIGSTDTHLSAPGSVAEDRYEGHKGIAESTLAERLDGLDLQNSAGGLAVVWAEENSRDALFEAMVRREVYATSGTRIVTRMFGGWGYEADTCDQAELVSLGYDGGVPMGGVLPANPGTGAPVFVVSALRDAMGAPLQRIQIVKGVLVGGEPEYRVYEVAGDPDNGASVDLATCTPQGAGFDSLCDTWTDPDFDPAQPAFYYGRVVENPTCRWHARQCLAAVVDCQTIDAEDPLARCCTGEAPATIHERAWTSPIWYTP